MAHNSAQKNNRSSKKKSGLPSFSPAPTHFTKTFYAHVMPSDLASLSAKDRECMAASIWQLAQTRKANTLNFRLYNPSPSEGWSVDHTVLEAVNDDMPFLVASLTGTLQRYGLDVHLVIHPVLQVRRSPQGQLIDVIASNGKSEPSSLTPTPISVARAESFIHIQFDQCLSSDLLKEIEKELRAVLSDVRASVEDWKQMRQRLKEAVEQGTTHYRPTTKEETIEDAFAFVRWLDDNNFTFLGYRDIDLEQEDGKLTAIRINPSSGLGILRDKEVRMFGGLRDPGNRKSAILQSYVLHDSLIIVTKTNQHSRVHRQVPMDAIFIRRFDKAGKVIGERLFVGLFTSQSYSQSPREVPFLRRKIDSVIARADLRPDSHDGKALAHILNNYPYDELFQISTEDLYKNALGILQLQERSRVALFLRRDPFGRFVTCLIYVPRDHYDSAIRYKFQHYLEKAYGSKVENWYVRIDDSIFARAFVTLHLTPQSPQPETSTVEADLREICRSWSDHLRDHLAATHGEGAALSLLRRYGDAFPATYRDTVKASIAVHDIHNLERSKTTSAPILVDLAHQDDGDSLHLKLFHPEIPITLSSILPLIENAGLKVEFMGGPYKVCPKDGHRTVYIHEFVGRPADASIVDLHHIKPIFEEAFSQIWVGDVENDPFNALTLRAGLSAREIVFMRTLARYLRQLRIPYSHEMIAKTFVTHPRVAQLVYALFYARHNPDLKGNRTQKIAEIEAKLTDALSHVKVLEEDRIIRRYINLVHASLRTNFFQADASGQPKSYVSIKFDSRAVEFMPLPKPLYEIFVYSTRTEAVHLRGGKVARGGIRWSDRRDDFRNEILGLMKAQMVKNSVIVPVGSKGGFIVKQPPLENDKLQAEGIACYKTMMRGLLDITDNRLNGKIIAPSRVVRHDGDDPYLVVAADKGTARFSDIANGISQEYKFWLDDAFASGGSAGYDHKEMGITARGAWEAVKRHFRELDKDIQTTDFTCVGVGDMSGDVFGNGMLLSKHIRLLGAFDHRHIFCDPNPDTALSYQERRRLFDLPRSSWGDYDLKKISKGGGVFSRQDKSIKLSPEIKKAYGITTESLSPAELIQVMLKADVELLYFGGIGTYVKATDETHEEVGDRATESLRIDGIDLRAKIIGEGANLGMTQRGRIEYALKGGRLNTDAIDNSAGVDTSDHEVNIKILLRKAVDKKNLSLDARNKLLASMTDDVAHLVLRDNYLQTQALSISEARAAEHLPLHIRTMHLLEKSGLLNRAVEFLPDDSELAQRQRSGKGLTRPELAVLMAYAKIWLYDRLLPSDVPEDSYTRTELAHYFPATLQKKYVKDISDHQLSREITATVITNSIVNHAGTNFILTLTDRTGHDAATAARAYLIAQDTFDLTSLWTAIEALDNQVPAKVQTHMNLIIREVLTHTALWFLTSVKMPFALGPIVTLYKKGVEQLSSWIAKNPEAIGQRSQALTTQLTSQGVPRELAQRVAMLPTLATALDLTSLSNQSGLSMAETAALYFGIGKRLKLQWLLEQAQTLSVQTTWQREAVAAIISDLTTLQRRITEIVSMKSKNKKISTEQKLANWLNVNQAGLERLDTQLNEWNTIGVIDISMLTLAHRQLNSLIG